jgi:6,7-dimethyl-8-ribityllumazine synthase
MLLQLASFLAAARPCLRGGNWRICIGVRYARWQSLSIQYALFFGLSENRSSKMLHQLNVPTPAGQAGLRIAFVQATWHRDIVDQCRLSFISEIAALGYAQSDIDFFEVAGAFEIPLHAKLLATSGRYAAIVAAGLVVDGGIYRHEFVAQAVITGLMDVQLMTGVPVISAVLTPHHFHAGDEHQKFYFEHFLVKGVEAARACASTVSALGEINALTRTQTIKRQNA